MLGVIKSENSVNRLIQAMNDKNANVRGSAASALGEIKSEKSTDALIQAMHDNDANVRGWAASALGKIKSEKSVDVLIQAMHDNDANVRWRAASALGEIKSKKSVDALIQAMHDNDANVRGWVASALGEIKSEKSIDALINAINDNDANVRGWVASGLGEIKSEKSVETLIQAMLYDNDANVRWRAASALSKIKSEKSVDALIQAIYDYNAKVRGWAASALGEIKSEKSVDALIQAIYDYNAKVRGSAALALVKIKSEKSVNALIQAMNGKNAIVRDKAASVLGEIKSEKSVDALIQAMHDNDSNVRRSAASALGEIKSKKSVEALINAINDNDAKVRRRVASVLSETCTDKHKKLFWNISPNKEDLAVANIEFKILKKIEMNEKSRAELFQHAPVPRTESPTPSISTAQQPETGALDPYFHIPVIEMSKIKKSTVILDYGCGFGKLLTPMKNLGADVLNNIHYIGVDAKTACLLKSSRTAGKYGLFKNEPEFMSPDVFFKRDITVDFAVLMHTLHEISLVDLVNSIYHITAKLAVGGQIFILEPGSFIEERNYVLWKDTDFKMIFSNHGFDLMPYPITTGKGNKLNAFNILKTQNENISKDTVAERCLLMFEAKKKELFRMLNNNPTGSEKDKEIDLLYSYVSRQIDEYKAI